MLVGGWNHAELTTHQNPSTSPFIRLSVRPGERTERGLNIYLNNKMRRRRRRRSIKRKESKYLQSIIKRRSGHDWRWCSGKGKGNKKLVHPLWCLNREPKSETFSTLRAVLLGRSCRAIHPAPPRSVIHPPRRRKRKGRPTPCHLTTEQTRTTVDGVPGNGNSAPLLQLPLVLVRWSCWSTATAIHRHFPFHRFVGARSVSGWGAAVKVWSSVRERPTPLTTTGFGARSVEKVFFCVGGWRREG